MLKLYDLLMPKAEICREHLLYYRIKNGLEDQSAHLDANNQMKLTKGAIVSFDTYFNAFTYSKYLKYTYVNRLGILLNLQGEFLVSLKAFRKNESGETETVLLSENNFKSSDQEKMNITYDFSGDSSEGYCYIELEALSDQAVFLGGFYYSELKESNINSINLAVAICTYKREEFVYRNMKRLNQYYFDNPNCSYKDMLKVLIIDNGYSIDRCKVENAHISVFENKNFGGSGGFTRGMIEAYREKDRFSHVLLMDDDIVFEPEVLFRTITLLMVMRSEYQNMCVGGGMLRLDQQNLQHESGGHWDGMRVQMQKINFDLSDNQNLLINEMDHGANYNGWWYFCMPLHLIDQRDLPFPFFIKDDDTEYGLRLSLSKNLLLMNGIGIWHEPFDAKYRVHLEYYVKRNEAILSVIHYPEYGVSAHLFKLMKATLKNLIYGRFSALQFILKAYEDFLEGPDFFLKLNEEELNTRLIKQSKERKGIKEIVGLVTRLICVPVKMIFHFNEVADAYRKRKGEITSMKFWCDHLKI